MKGAVCSMIDATLPGYGTAIEAIDQAYDACDALSNWRSMSKNQKAEFWARSFLGFLPHE